MLIPGPDEEICQGHDPPHTGRKVRKGDSTIRRFQGGEISVVINKDTLGVIGSHRLVGMSELLDHRSKKVKRRFVASTCPASAIIPTGPVINQPFTQSPVTIPQSLRHLF